MRLYRRSGVQSRVRRRASLWVSFGIFVVLSVSVAVLMAVGSSSAVDDNGRPRRLKGNAPQGGSGFPDDPLIDKCDTCEYKHKDAKNKYWIFIHIIIIAYMLLGLNTVCDLYFTGALDEMVDKWDIKPDVAGATFMAAGGSAPELFTSLIGTMISGSDVGFSTIVGSAVFNVLFVIGLCGFVAEVPIKLTWWPLFRDCTYYVLGLSMLAVFAKTGGDIELWEAILLFLGYVGYCILMYFNPQLEARFVQSVSDPVTELRPIAVIPEDSSSHVTVVAADTGSTDCTEVEVDDALHPCRQVSPMTAKRTEERQDTERRHIRKTQAFLVSDANGRRMDRSPSKEPQEIGFRSEESVGNAGTGTASTERSSGSVPLPEDEKPPILPVEDIEDEEEEEEEDDISALLSKPEGTLSQAIWFMCLPVYATLYYGIPKPTARAFPATFGISLLWIAGFSFFLVYCVEILGSVMGIHVTVMGFTLLAAGTSIPDLVSSMAVARAGEGDMAVSSSIGSNIFDILVGLPIPWIIKILFVEMLGKGKSSYTVRIVSDYIVLYVIILVVMVGAIVVSIHALGWYLNRTLGFGMAFLYALFLATVLTVEFETPAALKF